MDYLDIAPIKEVTGTVVLPGSKSISNRILLLAALAKGKTEVKGLLESDDVNVMLKGLKTLGVQWQRVEGTNDYFIEGTGGQFPNKNADIFLGNAGTAFRSLTAALAFSQGQYKLSGIPRMHERPIGDLVDALKLAGAKIGYLEKTGFPPLQIHPADLAEHNNVSVKGNVSSQFLTALIMALPITGKHSTVSVVGELISKPYVEITLNLTSRFGLTVERNGWESFSIPAEQTYKSPGKIYVEGDASSASYFLAAGAINGAPVRVEGIGKNSIQGDIKFADVLQQMGATVKMGDNWVEVSRQGLLSGIDVDLNHIPDAAMTIAVAALFAKGPTIIRNVASWRVKETDRLAAMAKELRKVGAEVEEGQDYIKVTPPAHFNSGAVIDTYDDHRMAMCFSLVALGGVPVRIMDPQCVNKTFPQYFDELKRITN